MLLTTFWLVDVLILLSTATCFLYMHFSRKFNYWKTKNVYYIPPVAFFGNAFELLAFKKSIGHWFESLYNSVNEPFFGAFILDEPFLILKSPQLIKQVLVKDFNYFVDRTVLAPKHNKLFENIMFMQKSPEWKKVKAKVRPLFTPLKLKGMFPLMQSIGLTLNEYIRQNINQQLEAKEMCAKYATDVIAKCVFAMDVRSFSEKESDFRKVGNAFFGISWKTAIRQGSYFFMQNLANTLRLDFVDEWASQYLRDVFWQAIKLREESNVKANDLIDIIVNMRRDKELCTEIDFEGDKVVAQAVMFFAAGFETTSSTIAFTLYELCINPHLQDKLRIEIMKSIEEYGCVTYESVMTMKYLDMCLCETLRKYPALPFLDRRCNQDYNIPGTNVVIEKGMAVYVPLLGLHHDEKYFPEPEKYDPERFFDKKCYNEDGLRYLPFGEGPRSCIGDRFGAIAAKLALVQVVSEYMIEKSEDTPTHLEYEPRCLTLASKVGLPMKFNKIDCRN